MNEFADVEPNTISMSPEEFRELASRHTEATRGQEGKIYPGASMGRDRTEHLAVGGLSEIDIARALVSQLRHEADRFERH